MFDNGKIANILGTIVCALIVIFLAAVVPYSIISFENHHVIKQIDKIRFVCRLGSDQVNGLILWVNDEKRRLFSALEGQFQG
jgi:hypothetical protein